MVMRVIFNYVMRIILIMVMKVIFNYVMRVLFNYRKMSINRISLCFRIVHPKFRPLEILVEELCILHIRHT